MYSRIDILNAVKKGDLKIKPFNKKMLQPNSLKVHLDNEIVVALKGRIDPVKTSDFEKFYKKIKLGSKGFEFKPGMFILGRTSERLSFSKKVCGLIQGRTSLARIGIEVTQTAPLIHSGHGVPKPRKIVLEMSNSGPFTVIISPGMVIAELAFFELKTPTDILYDFFGRYGKRKDLDELLPLKE